MPTTPGPTHEEIAELAYQLWEERGRPIGSPEIDWALAEQTLAAGAQPGPPTGSAPRQRAEHNS